jgi:twitching motility protein PilT
MQALAMPQHSSPKPASMEDLLLLTRDLGATDLHMSGHMPPAFRIKGQITPYNCPAYSPAEVEGLLAEIMASRHHDLLRKNFSVDLGLHKPGIGRFRVVIYYQRGCMSAAIRLLADGMPSFADLGLPQSLAQLPSFRDGLVLVTGATGSGKSTTLATIIDEINRTSCRNIITIEDPIEYEHANLRSIIFQRELHTDVASFAEAIRDALRQDPDVILVGEMRDPETIRTAITAAETGHLVLSTLHSRDATSSINRIVGTFPAGEQNQIRQQLSTSLRTVVSQRLLANSSGSGRVPAVEIMFINTGIANLIRNGKDEMVYSSIETGLKEGMQTMEQSLIRLVYEGRITVDTALSAARRPDLLQKRLTTLRR